MDIRSQLAEEFIQELQAVAEENSMLLRYATVAVAIEDHTSLCCYSQDFVMSPSQAHSANSHWAMSYWFDPAPHTATGCQGQQNLPLHLACACRTASHRPGGLCWGGVLLGTVNTKPCMRWACQPAVGIYLLPSDIMQGTQIVACMCISVVLVAVCLAVQGDTAHVSHVSCESGGASNSACKVEAAGTQQHQQQQEQQRRQPEPQQQQQRR